MPAVPFLIELVASPTILSRGYLLDLLSTIAFSHWWQRFEARAEEPLIGDAWERSTPPTTDEYQQQVVGSEKQVEQAYNAVAAGLPLYLRILDEDPVLRLSALEVLCCFRHASSVIVPHLRALLESETDARCLATLIRSLARFNIDDPWYGAFCAQVLEHAPNRETRLAAAIVQSRVSAGNPSPYAVELLASAVATRYAGLDRDKLFSPLPVSAVPEALLAYLSRDAVVQAAPTLIDGLQACTVRGDFVFVLDAIINMLFRNPRLPWPADGALVAARMAALRAIVGSSFFDGNSTVQAALWRLGRVLFADGVLGAGITTRTLLPEQGRILRVLLEDPKWEGGSIEIVLWVERLLCSFFVLPHPDQSSPLLEEQVATLRRIASTGFWQHDPAPLAQMLHAYDLPSTQEGLAEYARTHADGQLL